ncbi:hypothetical protein NE237_011459 [Protea cynaroides]|uniref:Uncharacterized protein n=1 Tax=Protea cynaroides TaxID=273540 RepID=A0A9Q0JWT6_9MAGN|nr:hypothetical protein NE237_011459 [Protea cynaroides]
MDTAPAVGGGRGGAGVEEQQEVAELPQLLLFAPPSPPFLGLLAKSFRLLKPWEEESMSTQQFLTTQAQSVRALACIGLFQIDSEILRCLPSLQLVVATSVGVDHVDLAECRRRGIAVTNAGPSFAEDCADLAVGLLLDVLRRISAADRYVRQGLWPIKGDFPLGSKLGGKRVGIIGLGNIGSEVAKRLEAFGCNISYNSRKKKPSVAFPFYSNVHDLAANSDVLILSGALTKETYHIIDRDVLLAMGEKGVIINVGRGALIDEKELVRCLVKGEIGGAGLDVYENEPDVPKELLVLDNVVLSPHKAALTPESIAASGKMAVANLEAFFAGKPLLSPVKDE